MKTLDLKNPTHLIAAMAAATQAGVQAAQDYLEENEEIEGYIWKIEDKICSIKAQKLFDMLGIVDWRIGHRRPIKTAFRVGVWSVLTESKGAIQ